MKTIKLFALLILVLFTACHDDDSPLTVQPQPASTIEGEWKLINVNGGIAGINQNFPEGMITWKINGISQTIVVVNNNTNEQLQDILPSGTYHYTIAANPATPELCAQNLVIEGTNMGCFNFTGTEFTMSQIETDGFAIRLVR